VSAFIVIVTIVGIFCTSHAGVTSIFRGDSVHFDAGFLIAKLVPWGGWGPGQSITPHVQKQSVHAILLHYLYRCKFIRCLQLCRDMIGVDTKLSSWGIVWRNLILMHGCHPLYVALYILFHFAYMVGCVLRVSDPLSCKL